MLSKKIFISKLGPPQKLPSRAQAAPRAHGHGLGPVRAARPRHPAPRGTPYPHPTAPARGRHPLWPRLGSHSAPAVPLSGWKLEM